MEASAKTAFGRKVSLLPPLFNESVEVNALHDLMIESSEIYYVTLQGCHVPSYPSSVSISCVDLEL